MPRDSDGVEIAVGDTVQFKSDIEQCGRVTQVNGNQVRVHNPDGFGGSYLRYDTDTWIEACRCWVD
jgi:FKBP-type peptidyl-prolyl cis-trans isomerase 2